MIGLNTLFYFKTASYFRLVIRGHGDSQVLIASLKVVIGDLSVNYSLKVKLFRHLIDRKAAMTLRHRARHGCDTPAELPPTPQYTRL